MDVLLSDAALIRSLLPRRKADAHKGDCGRLLSVCGSYTMPGASLLCASAALKSGVGLVCVAVPESAYPLIAAKLSEPIYLPLPCVGSITDGTASSRAILPELHRADAVVFGCGIGNREELFPLLATVLCEAKSPIVLDADGINLLSRNMLMAENHPTPLLVTPHLGEMARLTGKTADEIQKNRAEIALQTAKKLNATVVLKGHRTLIASPDGRLAENRTGNAGMAVGGSGDALAGILGALLAQGVKPFEAAVCAAYLHGAAGDVCAQRLTQFSLTPTDLIAALPEVFRKIVNGD